jgi:nucleoside-diphosphate-sugar epimerase
VTVIVHIAHLPEDSRDLHSGRVGITAPGFTPEGATEHRRVNLAAMRNVLAAAAKVRRVVYCSSWSSYGVLPAGTAVDESTPSTAFDCTVPTGLCGGGRVVVPYFASKLECEELLRAELEAGRVREGVILQPCSVFGRYGEAGWCQIFGKLLKSGGRMPGLPGSSSFCDAQDLAAAFAAAATAGPGRCERYVIGGTNASSLEMQSIMGELVGVAAPSWASPPTALRFLSRWNECLLHLGPVLRLLRIMPATIGSPCLVAKITQDQSADSAAAQRVLGYRPRALRDILHRNHLWLVETGRLARNSDTEERTPLVAGGESSRPPKES